MKKVKELLRRVKEAARAKLEKAKASILPVASAAVTALAMSPVAHAEGETGGDMSAVLSATDTVISLMNKVWGLMTSNPLLTVFLAVSLLMVGIRVFKRVKAAAR